MELTTRDRLLLAFASLGSYGIDAHPAVDGNDRVVHARLESESTTAHPNGSASYVFWLWADEDAFSPHGQLPQIVRSLQ